MRKEQKILRRQFLKELTKALIYNSLKNTKFPQTPEAQKTKQPPQEYQSEETNNLLKLRELIINPSVQTIESPGPLKQVIIHQDNMTQPTNIRLTAEDINKIMGEFSQKTRIPLVPGIFKAALGHIVVTAVISDYLGTRFIIQKR